MSTLASAPESAPPPRRPDAAARFTVSVAALAGFSGVALGAFGAHGLRDRLTATLLDVYRTGVLYHLVHALALLGTAALFERLRWPRGTTTLFAGGIVVFSGSLYILAVTGVGKWGAVTPIGGVLLLAGWLSLLWPRPRP